MMEKNSGAELNPYFFCIIIIKTEYWFAAAHFQ